MMPCGANELAHRSLSPRGVLVGISKCVRRGHAKGWERDPRVMRWYGSKPRTEARCASRPAFGSSGILPSVLHAQKGGISHVERATGVEGRVVVAQGTQSFLPPPQRDAPDGFPRGCAAVLLRFRVASPRSFQLRLDACGPRERHRRPSR